MMSMNLNSLLALPALPALLALHPLRGLLNYLSYLGQLWCLSHTTHKIQTKSITCSIHAKQSPATVHFPDTEFPVQRVAAHKLNGGHSRALGFLVIVYEKVVPYVHRIKRETGTDGVFDGIRRVFNNVHRSPSLVNSVLGFESAVVSNSLMSLKKAH